MDVSCHNAYMIDADRPAQGIRDLKKAGFDSLALGLGVWFPDFYGRNRKKDVKPVKEKDLRPVSERYALLFASCRENGIHIPLVYGPSFELADPLRDDDIKGNFVGKDGSLDVGAISDVEAKLTAFCVDVVGECLEFCGRNGVKYICIRPVSGDGACGREWDINHDFYMRLAQKAKENGVCILLQNLYKSIGGHLVRGICSESSAAAEWVDRLNAEAGEDIFGFCVDSGICNICSNDMHEFIATLGKRIKAVILRDCDGKSDTAMLPFTCVRGGSVQTDWMGLIRGLRDINYDGELIMNFSGTTAAFSPLLSSAVFRMAKEVGEFFKWQIGLEQNLKKYKSIVLFGAGNMCRNYMKCYGEKYPPLFTCDNNKTRWGEQFVGLEIKPPESLRELPMDCAVFICNIYYREIEQQLREMGIANPIEYFSDEYMPSYYFDTLEYWAGKT